MSTIMQENTENSFPEKISFQLVSDPPSLLPILEHRLPHSSMMYNQLKTYETCKSDLKVYSLHQDQSDEKQDADEVWVVFNNYREDWGATISISPPTCITSPDEIPFKIQKALENTNILDWTKPFVILPIDPPISDFIVKLNIRKYGNVIKIMPCYLYYMDPEEALKLELEKTCDDSQVELRPLSSLEGTQFLTQYWPHGSTGKENFIRKSIEKHISAGVYVKNGKNQGEFVCGVLAPAYGILSTLVNHPDHRRKGYASLTMKYICKQMAEKGLHPIWDADISDPNAVAFHNSLNPKMIAKIDYICHKTM